MMLGCGCHYVHLRTSFLLYCTFLLTLSCATVDKGVDFGVAESVKISVVLQNSRPMPGRGLRTIEVRSVS